MKQPRNLRVHLFILTVVLALTGGAHVALRHHYADERNTLAHKAAGVRAREIQAAWKGLPYICVLDSNAIDQVVTTIDWGSINLPAVQKTKLRGRVRRVLAYLSAPTFDEYIQLKRTGLHYRFSPSRSAQLVLADSPKRITQPESLQGGAWGKGEIDIARAVWERTAALQGPPRFSRLTGVSLHRVSVALSATNTPTALLKGSVAKGWTSAIEALNPGFQYPHLSDRPTTNSSSLFFHISFFAQTEGGNGAGPVYLCLGWLPDDEEWALCRMISDSMLGIRVLF